jgi:hypothetical protein
MIGEGNSDTAERDRSSHETQHDRAAMFPAHAPIEHAGGTAS